MTSEQTVVLASDGVELAGEIVRPDGGPSGAALVVSGSGPLDRDSNMAGQALDIGRSLASALAVHGVVSLRIDKRGVGRSSGEYLTTSFARETDDAESALLALRGASGVDPTRVTVIGHSVGATIAVRLAARNEWIAGVVLLAASSVPGAEVMRTQSERIGASLRGLRRLGARRFLQRQARARDVLLASTGDVVRIDGVDYPARWFREYMAYDPAPDLGAVRCPVLAITGGSDLQVDPADVAHIGEFVGGPFTGSTPVGLTHVLRTHAGRQPGLSAYPALLRRPVDAELLQAVAEWVAACAPVARAPRP